MLAENSCQTPSQRCKVVADARRANRYNFLHHARAIVDGPEASWVALLRDALDALTTDADDRLLAAAPDLLAACKFALSQMDAAGLLCGDLAAAIAKAEGLSA